MILGYPLARKIRTGRDVVWMGFPIDITAGGVRNFRGGASFRPLKLQILLHLRNPSLDQAQSADGPPPPSAFPNASVADASHRRHLRFFENKTLFAKLAKYRRIRYAIFSELPAIYRKETFLGIMLK